MKTVLWRSIKQLPHVFWNPEGRIFRWCILAWWLSWVIGLMLLIPRDANKVTADMQTSLLVYVRWLFIAPLLIYSPVDAWLSLRRTNKELRYLETKHIVLMTMLEIMAPEDFQKLTETQRIHDLVMQKTGPKENG